MPSWVEIAAAIGGIGGAIGAVGGVVGAIGGVRANQARDKAATAIRDSADAGRDAADALRLAAEANTKATELAESSLRLEHERRHDDLRPPTPPIIEIEREEVTNLGGGPGSVFGIFGSISVPRDYRVRVDAANTRQTSWRVNLPLLLREGSHRFEIEQWSHDRRDLMAKELWFRFWPPAEVDEAEYWTCPCDRPLAGGGDRDPGHWEWRVPVEYRYTPPEIF